MKFQVMPVRVLVTLGFALGMALAERALCENSGNISIFEAVQQGDLEMVKRLLATDPQGVNARDKYGYTPLHWAAGMYAGGGLEKVEFLVKNNADVNAGSKLKTTPLHLAAMRGASDVARFLIARGAKVNAGDAMGRTALFVAKGRGITEALIAAGAEVNAHDFSGWTPLHEAAWSGDAGKVLMLIEKGADINVRDDQGWTPLHGAVRMGQKPVVEALLAAKADFNTADHRGRTPLDEARWRGFSEAQALLEPLFQAARGKPKQASAIVTTAISDVPADRIKPGDFVVERPTLVCVGFKWYVSGDDNRNAKVDVAYRKKGRGKWKKALPLLRIKEEECGDKRDWKAPNMFAGSIFDLKPGTEHEVRLVLEDPDGGKEEKNVVVRTRPEPVAFEKGKRLHVYPKGFTGRKKDPGFEDVSLAYAQAQPGDILLIHAGNYQKDLIFNKKATPDRPIVIRGAGDGEAKLQGEITPLINANGSAYHIIEDLTLWDSSVLVQARGSMGFVLRRCKLHTCDYNAIDGLDFGTKDIYIADNEIIGPVDQWTLRKGRGDHAVWLMGQGHVVCHNRILKWWDGIDYMGGKPPEDRNLQNCSGDFYGNEISECMDDAIEMDYGEHNIRVFRNKIYNVFSAISSQPLFGGPGYIFRNVVYNTTRMPLKPNCWPAGLLIFNNTFVCCGSAGRWATMWQNTRIYNNLFMGTAEGEPGVIWTGTPTPETSRMDYNGWHFPSRKEKELPIWWKFTQPRDTWAGSSLTDECGYKDFNQFTVETGYEKNGVLVDYGVFVKAPPPSGKDDPLPELDLRLKPDTRALDAGMILPNITDGFTGKAPDLGAYETGLPVPPYGPRGGLKP